MTKKKRPDKPKEAEMGTAQLGARIPLRIYNRLAHYVVDAKRPQKDVIAEALSEYLDRKGAKTYNGD